MIDCQGVANKEDIPYMCYTRIQDFFASTKSASALSSPKIIAARKLLLKAGKRTTWKIKMGNNIERTYKT